jgi:hypothetical protein
MSASPSLKKFGECLYRNPPSRTYFARVKHRSKEIKQSVKTNNLPVSAAKTEGLSRPNWIEEIRRRAEFRFALERGEP